jgi:hypothetical protein
MRKLTQLFILISFLVGVIAPACGFSWSGKFSVIEICTAQGIESRIVENSQNDQNDAPKHQISELCQFCFQNAHLKDTLPSPQQINTTFVSIERATSAQYETFILNNWRRSQTLRGPPALI